jgi:hypothetical protein
VSPEHLAAGHPRLQQAIAELQTLITTHYPTATFTVGPGGENPDGTYLTARVDLDDPDPVLDLVIERILELQLEEHRPVHVVPVLTPARVERLLQERQTDTVPTVPPPYL